MISGREGGVEIRVEPLDETACEVCHTRGQVEWVLTAPGSSRIAQTRDA